MLLTPHALVGAAIGARLKHPLAVIPVAILSHFLLDTVPHWQETLSPYRPNQATWVRLPLDALLALVGVAWIVRRSRKRGGRMLAASAIVGAVAGVVPDVDALACANPLLLKHGLLSRYFFWHCGIQDETPTGWGVVTQAVVTLAALAVATRKR
ncbi:MAG TPA: hypothetical protein VH593_04400 [Ktedonobacteraceae bacterium]|jgi:hypothetical protein